jgi:hypothetical protein
MKSKPLLDNGKGKRVMMNPPKSTATPERHSSVAVSRFSHPHAPSMTTGADGTDREKPTPPDRATNTQSTHTDKTYSQKFDAHTGLRPPQLLSQALVTGESTARLRIENKRHRRKLQREQKQPTWWTTHEGNFTPPQTHDKPIPYRNNMCPRGLALHHPAASLLQQYAVNGCPTDTGAPWTREQVQAAIDRGPHVSALVPAAMEQLDMEVQEKVASGQARIVRWNDIRHAPPPQLKISPVAMVPHKSRPYRAILDLSFPVHLSPTTTVPSVNTTTTKTAPRGAIDQIGHVLPRIIHAFASVDNDAKIFMAKWDIKDGFWRLDCEAGEEWNFSYVLPSSYGSDDIKLVVPTSLQMGWIESPPYFCAASETARDVATMYAEQPLDANAQHPALPHTQTHADYKTLPTARAPTDEPIRYLMEVYMDDFIDLVIPVCQHDLDHIAVATMTGIHDVFPPSDSAATDPISEKKLARGEGAWANVKEILGMTFDGINKTIWLAPDKRDALLLVLKSWIRKASKRIGIVFNEFRTTLSKLQHAFLTVPAGRGLLSTFYQVLAKEPAYVYLHSNANLYNAVRDCRTFLRDTIGSPTKCKNLVMGWPDYVGITDASGHELGGVIIGENKAVPPVVFRLQWQADISACIVSDSNPDGTITNSDLEMAGLLMLWLVMEEVCTVENAHVALFSDNSPTVHWVQRLAAKHSTIAMQLVRALALRLQLAKASPLTPMHIAGVNNSLTDIPSRSFGSDAAWYCKNDAQLLTLFNSTFPLPHQGSWTVFHLSSEIAMRVISILQMKVFTADEWRRLPKKGKLTGSVGSPMSSLWEWTHTFNKRRTNTEFVPCLDLPQGCDPAPMAEESKFALAQSVAQSRPLAR